MSQTLSHQVHEFIAETPSRKATGNAIDTRSLSPAMHNLKDIP